MELLKITRNVKASPDIGKICFYEKDEFLDRNDKRYSLHIEKWLLKNGFAILCKKEELCLQYEDISSQEEQKSLGKAIENKSLGKAKENKKISVNKKRKGKK